MKIKNIINSKCGEGYIDVVVGIIVSMMILVLVLNVFSFLTIKQDMDYFAKEMIFTASAYGRTNEETDTRYDELTADTGIEPEVTWEASYYNDSDKTVQYGNTITVTLTYHTYLKGLGVFKIPIMLTAKHSGLSQKYWK
jgi:hypothetical protein